MGRAARYQSDWPPCGSPGGLDVPRGAGPAAGAAPAVCAPLFTPVTPNLTGERPAWGDSWTPRDTLVVRRDVMVV